MKDLPETLVINESKEDVSKMKEALAAKEKFYIKLNKVGNSLTTLSQPVFIASILSPFDFEGPLIEIISAVTLGIGALTKVIAKGKLENIEAIRTNGTANYTKVSFKVDAASEEDMKTALNRIMEARKEIKKTKSSRKI